MAALLVLLGLHSSAATLPAAWVQANQSNGSTQESSDSSTSQDESTAQSAPEAEDQVADDTWANFRGNQRAHAFSETKLPEQIELCWDVQLDEGGFIGAPLIFEDKVYLADMDGLIMVFEFDTGEKGWTVDLDAFVDASPAIIDRTLIVGDLDGFLYGIDIDAGELAWKRDLESSFITSVNTFEGDVIAIGETGDLFRLKPKTGETVWQFRIDDRILSFPSIADGNCFLTGCNSQLYGISLSDPEITSTFALPTPSGVTPALEESLAYFSISGGTVHCVDWKEGEEKWSYSPARGDEEIASSPALSPDTLVVAGGANRQVTAIDRATGEQRWSYTTRRMVNTSPVIADKQVVIAGNDGRLYVFDLYSGEIALEYEFGGVPAAAPAIASGRIVLATNQGAIYCFGEK